MRTVLWLALCLSTIKAFAADADLAPQHGAEFIFERRLDDQSGSLPSRDLAHYLIRVNSDGTLDMELVANGKAEGLFVTDRNQNILEARYPEDSYRYRPFRPAYFLPLSEHSHQLYFFQETSHEGKNALWHDCAAIVRVKGDQDIEVSGRTYSGIVMHRILVCDEGARNIRVETEDEIFCPKLKYSCAFSARVYTGEALQPNYIKAHLRSAEDFADLEAKLVFFELRYEFDLKLKGLQ